MRSGWAALWVVLGMAVLRGALTLPGAVLSPAAGPHRRPAGPLRLRGRGPPRPRGHARARPAPGRDRRRARGPHGPCPEARAWVITGSRPLGYTEQVREQVREQVSENPLGPAPRAGGRTSPPPRTPPLRRRAGHRRTHRLIGRRDRLPLDSTPLDTAGTGGTGAPAGANTIRPATDVDLAAVLAEASSEALSQERASVHRMYAVGLGRRAPQRHPPRRRSAGGRIPQRLGRIRVRGLSSPP